MMMLIRPAPIILTDRVNLNCYPMFVSQTSPPHNKQTNTNLFNNQPLDTQSGNNQPGRTGILVWVPHYSGGRRSTQTDYPPLLIPDSFMRIAAGCCVLVLTPFFPLAHSKHTTTNNNGYKSNQEQREKNRDEQELLPESVSTDLAVLGAFRSHTKSRKLTHSILEKRSSLT